MTPPNSGDEPGDESRYRASRGSNSASGVYRRAMLVLVPKRLEVE
jgi:hypothetical protein